MDHCLRAFYSFYKETKFSSQYQHFGSQTSLPGNMTPSDAHRAIHAKQTHIDKIKQIPFLNKKKKSWKHGRR